MRKRRSRKRRKRRRRGGKRGREKERKKQGRLIPVRMFCLQKESKRMRRGNGNDKTYEE